MTDEPKGSGSPEANPKTTRRLVASSKAYGSAPEGFASFQQSTAEDGLSKQIPAEVLAKLANEVVDPPLGPRSFEELAKLLLQSTDFATVVSQLATDVVGLGYHLVPSDQKKPIDPAEEQLAKDFLENTESETTIEDVLRAVWTDYESLGNAWMEVIRENDDPNKPPSGLAHAPGITMRIRNNLRGYVQLSLDETKVTFFRQLFSDPNEPTSQYPKGHPLAGGVMNELVFLREYHSASAWYGVPRVVPAINAIKGSLYSAERNIRFFLNRAMPEWVVQIEGNTDDIATEDLNTFTTDIEEHFRNILKGEDYRTLVLEIPNGIKVTFQNLSGDTTDADFRQYRIDNRDEILRAHQMMPNRVGIIEAGNLGGGTGESQIEIYKAKIRPRQEKVERVLNQLLRSEKPRGLGLKTLLFRFKEIDAVDELREAQIGQILGGLGWMTINEGRQYASRFLGIKLEPIDEEWAEIPLPVLTATSGPTASLELSPNGQSDGGLVPGMSRLGTPMAPSPEIAEKIVGAIRIATDRAYRKIADARRGNAG